ncbi:hypothetical protein MBLNU230_g0393t1 [Neophaeotheca triangularis]
MYSSLPAWVLPLCFQAVKAQSGAQPVGLAYGNNALPVTKDSDIVSQAFPEVEGIELLSPAFLNPETVPEGFEDGTSSPTDLRVMDSFYRNLAARNDWLTYQSGDFLSEENRQIPYLYLTSTPYEPCEHTKLKVYIQADIHGNEPAAGQGLMALLGKMDANQTWTESVLRYADILALPRYNVDGVAYFQRQLANNYDPNREHIKLFRKQSREIKQKFSDFSPDVSIDLHEYTASNVFGGEYQHASDSLISGGINPNIHEDIRSLLLDNFIPATESALAEYGLRQEPYVVGPSSDVPGTPIEFTEAVTEARTGRNAYGLTQTVSFLLEMRGIRIANQHFQRRCATALIKLTSILETIRDDYENVSSTIARARDDFISSDSDIIITDSYRPTNRTFTLVDINNGSVVQVPVGFEATTPSVANLTRPRPEAYLIPSTHYDVAERLRILGLEVQTLDYEYRGPVEALNITSSVLDQEVYEGTVLNSVETVSYATEVSLPYGSYLVSTRQKNAALAFIALEPENIDSFVTYNIVQVTEADQYPVFRVMK